MGGPASGRKARRRRLADRLRKPTPENAPQRGVSSRGPVVLRGRPLLARAVLVLLLAARHHIDATEPPVEVDVGAPLGAERPECLHCRLAADRAGTRERLLGHAMPSHRPAVEPGNFRTERAPMRMRHHMPTMSWSVWQVSTPQ